MATNLKPQMLSFTFTRFEPCFAGSILMNSHVIRKKIRRHEHSHAQEIFHDDKVRTQHNTTQDAQLFSEMNHYLQCVNRVMTKAASFNKGVLITARTANHQHSS